MDNENKVFAWFRSLRLQTVLTGLLLAINIPLLLILVGFISTQAADLLEVQAMDQLHLNSEKLATNQETWLRLHQDLLRLIANDPDIISMDPERQKPVLQAINRAYPHLFLTMTTDVNGMNIARNDDQENLDYSDRLWFRGAAAGATFSSQSLISRTSGQPALNMATAIQGPDGDIIGVGSIVSDLDDLSSEVQASQLGETGYSFIIDNLGQVIAHPDPAFSQELRNLSDYPPVVALHGGLEGDFRFTDQDGVVWRAHMNKLPYGWGVITQQQEVEVLAAKARFNSIAGSISMVAIALIAVLVSFVVGQGLAPITELTKTAQAITAGNLTLEARVRRNDEVGVLAKAFNQMTAELRSQMGQLEQRVEARTRALRASFQVSQRLASILSLEELTARVVDEIRSAFDYYHVQIYLYDSTGEYLEMAGGTGEAGQQMLARGHRLGRGRGLVGRAAANAEIIYVPDTGQDPAWLPNPLLPETRAEVAVPLQAGDQVLGVLDVQLSHAAELEQSDLELLQSVANQVAVAAQNVRRYSETQTQAELESQAGAIFRKLQAATSVEAVLETAVRELSETLHAHQGSIQVSMKDSR